MIRTIHRFHLLTALLACALQLVAGSARAQGAPADVVAEMAQLKQQLASARATLSTLQADVAALKAKQPANGQPLTVSAPFIVKDKAGSVIFQVDVPADRSTGRAVIGNPAGSHVEMGPAFAGSAIAMYDSGQNMLMAMVADPQGSYLRIRDNDQTVSLGSVEGAGTGLFLRKNGQIFADVSADKAGAGVMRIFNASGKKMAGLSSIAEGGTVTTYDAREKAVAGVFAGTDGGHVTLTGPGSAKTAVHLSVTDTGGKVRVFPAAGGKARAELTAEGDNGAVTVFNTQGTSAVVLESASSGSGHIVVLNGSGENAVEAGVMGGVGIVRAGPAGAGPAGSLGGGLSPASSIQGKKGGK